MGIHPAILRRRGVGSRYGELGLEPPFVAGFGKEYYRANSTRSTFAATLDHAATTNATMVDSDGLLKWRPHNLLTYSEDLSNAAWTSASTATISSGVTDPNGGANAFTLTVTGGFQTFRQNNTSTSGVTATQEIYIKRRTGSGNVQFFDGTSYQTLTVTTEWTLVSQETTSEHFLLRLAISGDEVDVAFARFYRSDLGGMVDNPDRGDSYVPTTSAAVYLPRRGHHIWDGSAWVNAGYLHESEARTNFLLSADDLSNASYWSPLSGASTPVATSPIMGANAWTLSGAGYLRQSGLSIAASTTHTVWFRMRLPSSPAAGRLRIRIYDSNSGAFITLANGSTVSDFVYDTSGAVTRDTSAVDFLTDEGNGVYLVGAAFTTLATVTTHFVFIYPDVSNSTQPVDVATPQLEAASTPSSYNKTTSAGVTRAADALSVGASDLPYNAAGMSGLHKLALNYEDTGTATEQTLFDWRADANNRITVTLDTAGANTGKVTLTVVNGGSSVSVTSTNQVSPGSNVAARVAWRVSASEINIALNGTAATAVSNTAGVPNLSSADATLGGMAVRTLESAWGADIGDSGIAEATA